MMGSNPRPSAWQAGRGTSSERAETRIAERNPERSPAPPTVSDYRSFRSFSGSLGTRAGLVPIDDSRSSSGELDDATGSNIRAGSTLPIYGDSRYAEVAEVTGGQR